MLAGIQGRLAEYAGEFKELTASLVQSLGQAPDLDMRFLSVRLNFNYAFRESTRFVRFEDPHRAPQ